MLDSPSASSSRSVDRSHDGRLILDDLDLRCASGTDNPVAVGHPSDYPTGGKLGLPTVSGAIKDAAAFVARHARVQAAQQVG